MSIVWDSPDRGETLPAYTRMYLKEEIQAEALVRNLPGFARFPPDAGVRVVAVEVKAGITFAEKWCRGLRAVGGLDGLQRRIVVYPRGPRLRTADGIDVLPFGEFCVLLSNDGVWDDHPG